MFRHAADRLPVTIILVFSCIDFILYFFVESLWVLIFYWLFMIIPKVNICAWNHHHQHRKTFRRKPLNRILEFFYALHTGATTNVWVLHHNLGHHKHYLDQSKDESCWQRECGKPMGKLEYTINVALTAYYRAYKVGKCYPKRQKSFVFFTIVTFAVVLLLFIVKPVAALFLFILPMVSNIFITSWVTYAQHSGLPTDSPFVASRNKLNRFYNLVTGNLGYHTAHHYKQGIHWSELPVLHEEIKDLIPDHLIKRSLF